MHIAHGPKWRLALALSVGGLWIAGSALAQTPSGPPNALQGFSQNRSKPVHIDAATLEVRNKDKIATFLGNVKMVQGDTTMRCKTMKVFYEQDAGPDANTQTAAKPGPGGSHQIKRLEADGDVAVFQKDQMATGKTGVFDMKSNTVTLLGGVVLTQGQDVAKGQRLIANLTTGVSKLECDDPSQCRVSMLLQNGDAPAQRKMP
jgi:lipopolysaccharide export system protein LptA